MKFPDRWFTWLTVARAYVVWLALRLSALYVSGGDPSVDLYSSVLIIVVTVVLVTMDGRRRNEHFFLANLGVPLPVTQADIITFMNGRPLQYEPGTKFAYSNYGYCLLGRVIEQKTGLSYEDYTERIVLSPLGISRMQIGHSNREDRVPGEVTYESKKESAYGSFNLENMDSHGGWLASAPDLARFAASFDKPDASPILSAASIETMFSLPATITREKYKPGEKYYACGWGVRDYGKGRRNTWHTGSLPGCHTFMARWSNGVNCVVLFNKRGDGFDEIDPILWNAVKSISNWPDYDLFDEML